MNKDPKTPYFSYVYSGFALIIVGVIIRLYEISSLDLSYFDEGAYILEAARMFHREPSMDYYYARPGYNFFLGLSRGLIEDPLLAGRLLSTLGFTITGFLILNPIKKLVGSKVAIIALAYFCFTALNVYYSRLLFPDSIVSTMLLGAIISHVLAEKKKSRYLSLLTGTLVGFAIVNGSYRIAPTLLGLALVFIFNSKKSGFEKNSLKRTALALMPATLIVHIFNQKFQFFSQIQKVLTASALTRDKDISKFQPDLLFFGFLMAFTTGALIIVIFKTIDWIKNRKAQVDFAALDQHQTYFIHLLWALLLSPIIFHTFYYLRTPKVFSTSLPALAILMALATVTIKSKTIRRWAVINTIALSIVQCFFVLDGMGLKNSTAFYHKLASLKGIVTYSNALSVQAITDVDPKQTQVVLGWDCGWNPASCNPDYSVVSPEAYALFDEKNKNKWVVQDTWDVKFVRWGSLLYHLETYDSRPQTIMTNFHPQVLKETPINWLILKKKTTND